jgi:iron(III) transport system substrate-binding protein
MDFMSYMRRTATAAAIVAMASAGMLGQAFAQGANTDRLVLYQDLSATQVLPIIEGFKNYYKKQTGRDITIDHFSQSGGQLQSTIVLEAKANAVKADAIMTSPDGMKLIAKTSPDLLADYTPKNLADAAVSPSVRAQSETTPGTLFNVDPYVIVYNTDKIKGDDIPRSWLDILKPKFEHQIGMGDIEQTSGSRAPLWFIVKKMGDAKGAPFGWAYYQSLGKLKPRLFDGHNPLVDNIASGELSIGIAGYSTAFRNAANGGKVAAVLPAEGAGAQPTSVDLVKKANMNPIGPMFVEWLISKDGQEAVYKGTRALPIRSDVVLDKGPFEFDTTSTKIEPLDPQWVSDNRTKNIAQFREAIGSF